MSAMLNATDFPKVVNVPIGTIMMYAGSLESDEYDKYLADAGWLICDGRSLDQNDYSDLYKLLGGYYGEGSGTFNIPDCRGLFVRGVDQGTEIDPDANNRSAKNGKRTAGDYVGTTQSDIVGKHMHYVSRTNSKVKVEADDHKDFYADYKVKDSNHCHTENDGDNIGSETRPKNIAFYYIIKCKNVGNDK